jgi:predicted dinucleotide-binding enzyme
MKIGIIGAGKMGGAITRRFRRLGHDVSVANSRGPETLESLATETGATPVRNTEAARDADLLVVSIPEGRVTTLPPGVLDGLKPGAPVIDTGNYYPQRDGQIPAIDDGLTESRWVSQQLGHPVIKVFNNIVYTHVQDDGMPKGAPGRIALPVAGDDGPAKALVMQLVNDLGFDAIDAGGLDDSWRQQPGAPVYLMDYDADGVRRGLAQAKPEQAPASREG